ncbi:hypothetical protein LSAT2_016957 [Lamellibrachia satsuma]|nr:hypothetical protein LSAT2_016957 [Lamellibrachia satsuma]
MDGWVGGWVGGWVDGWVDGWMDGWMGGWMDGWMDGWMAGLMDGWMDGWMGGWMDKWMGGWMDGLNTTCEEYDMKISVSQTETMKVNRTLSKLNINETQLQQVTEVKYIGFKETLKTFSIPPLQTFWLAADRHLHLLATPPGTSGRIKPGPAPLQVSGPAHTRGPKMGKPVARKPAAR